MLEAPTYACVSLLMLVTPTPTPTPTKPPATPPATTFTDWPMFEPTLPSLLTCANLPMYALVSLDTTCTVPETPTLTPPETAALTPTPAMSSLLVAVTATPRNGLGSTPAVMT